ncbi:MAG: 4'-phosphopantetheinyl transferase superfamily protein [Deltaproteobacteria bacterium]|jgi:phosphopantetheinyl transferase|nr:4'-phosphopantetheinyl transferase superfamily protein [Deltaproteobacteria bacterium]
MSRFLVLAGRLAPELLDRNLGGLTRLFGYLAEEQTLAIQKNRRPQDAALRLLVRVLLVKALDLNGLDGLSILPDLIWNDRGQPELKGSPLRLSFSHSWPYGACAVALFPVGVDVERIQPLAVGGAGSVFSDSEVRRISGSDDPQSEAIRLWTVKESGLKALGAGFLEDPKRLKTEPVFNESAGQKAPPAGRSVWGSRTIYFGHLPVDPGYWLSWGACPDFQEPPVNSQAGQSLKASEQVRASARFFGPASLIYLPRVSEYIMNRLIE